MGAPRCVPLLPLLLHDTRCPMLLLLPPPPVRYRPSLMRPCTPNLCCWQARTTLAHGPVAGPRARPTRHSAGMVCGPQSAAPLDGETDARLCACVYVCAHALLLCVYVHRLDQNRRAQRAFRERRLQYVQMLEDRVTELAAAAEDAERIQKKNSELQRLINHLREQNEVLRRAAPEVAAGLSPTYSDGSDRDSPGSSSTTAVPQVPTGPTLSYPVPPAAAVVGDNGLAVAQDGTVYDLAQLKVEVGEGSPAYQELVQHFDANGRLRQSFLAPLGGDFALEDDDEPEGDDDDAHGDGAPAANDDDGPVHHHHAAEPFHDLGALKPAAVALGAKRLVSDGLGPLPPLFPLITPPLSDTSSPAAYTAGVLDVAGALIGPDVPFTAGVSAGAAGAGAAAGLVALGGRDDDAVPDLPLPSGDEHPGKRTLRDADVYGADAATLPCAAHALARDAQLNRDPVEDELCERMRQKALLGEIDPSALNKAKFVKKTSPDQE